MSQYFLLLTLLLSGSPLWAGESDVDEYVFHSPKGKFSVRLIELEHLEFSKEDLSESIDHVNHVRYRMIISSQSGKEFVNTIYHDVYGWQPNAKKTDPRTVFSWLVWSPNENFVLLPPEGWASAPGTSPNIAYNLTSKYLWKRSVIKIDDHFWINPLVIVGNRHNDCDYNVMKFDGKTGITHTLRKNVHVYGYEIDRVDVDSFITKTELNNCAGDSDYEHFRPECEIWDRTTLASKSIKCPVKPQ